MALTAGDNGLQLATVLPLGFTAGVDKFALSYWVRWETRGLQSYDMLLGIVDKDGGQAQLNVSLFSVDSLFFRVAGQNAGSIRPQHGIGPGAWFHVMHSVDLSGGNVQHYLNGAIIAHVAIAPVQTRAIAEPAQWQIRLPHANKGRFRLDRVQLHGYLPDPQQVFHGEVNGGLLDFECRAIDRHIREIPPATVQDLASGCHLQVVTGTGRIDDEIAEPTANLTLADEHITHSGIIWRTAWRKGDGVSRIMPRFDGQMFFRLNNGGWVATDKYLQFREHIGFIIPPECRPTSAADVVEYSLPMGAVTVTLADFNANLRGACTNRVGVEPFSLPTERKPLACNIGLVRDNPGGPVNILDAASAYGNRVAKVAVNGVPTHSTTGEPCMVMVPEMSGYPWQGTLTCLWRGEPAAELVAWKSYGQPCEKAGDRYRVMRGEQFWEAQDYRCEAFPQLGFRADNPGRETFATDMAVVLHDADNIDRWMEGKRFTSRFLRRLHPYAAVRFMDEMEANASCVYDDQDIVPTDWQAGRCWKAPDATVAVLDAEPYSYPVPSEGYFGDGIVYRLTLESPRNAYRLSTGMWLTFLGAELNGKPAGGGWSLDCEAPGLEPNQVVIGRKGSGTLRIGQGCAVQKHSQELLPPEWISDFAEEYQAFHGRPIALWLTKPVTMTDRGWQRFCDRLDDSCPPNSDWFVELSNETWNYLSVFAAQYRYLEGTARRERTSGNDIHVRDSLKMWEDVAAATATSERRVRLVIGGQMVNPGVLKSRMTILRDKLGDGFADADVVMTVSNYFDDTGFDADPKRAVIGSDGIPVNVHGCVAAGPLGYLDMQDVAFRPAVQAYPAIKAEYNKPLVAYEGGPSWQAPPQYGEPVVRTVFAACHAPRAKWLQIGALATYQAEGGFDMLCCHSLTGRYQEATGKNWNQYGWWYQPAGDGITNVAGLQRYIERGVTDSAWYGFESPRAQAAEDWFTPPDPPEPLSSRLWRLASKYEMTSHDAATVSDAVAVLQQLEQRP